MKGKNGISREEYILISSSKVPANYLTASVVIERYIEIALPYQRALKGRPNYTSFSPLPFYLFVAAVASAFQTVFFSALELVTFSYHC